ncbi:universal stress protein UspA-like protein [Spongiibacter sp. IMCC21906]|jgi:universal stress protein A|uniref:universal stress protein n=1 Tax=Spongiibacter sp. IMCC21906 TaxID=1620392 RepID=UPI00062DF7B7|nr:universal stress protein [Spongiibacter sp. IMCC21906]AKH69739.1 universal stress protein UspA-like protein [Spongiibacter sp. IMCC21906]
MPNYKKIIVAVDLSEEAEPVMRRAAGMAKHHGAELHLLHVVEHLSMAYGGDIPMDFASIQEQLQEQASDHMATLGDRYGVAADYRHLLTGQADRQIHDLSEELGADLIILGSHGRKGFALLLGSTANSVLHGATCDVLAVRVGKSEE